MVNKRLRLWNVAAWTVASLVCLALTGAVVASARTGTERGAAAHRSLVTADGLVVSQGAKDAPLCALPKVCYSPALLQRAYDFPSGRRAPTGVGQTIMIVVPYGSPTIAADLATFDAAFNVAPPQSFSIVNGPGAGGVGTGDLVGWGVETAASVEYAHAMAPGASIVLVVSPTDDLVDVVATEAQLLPLYPGAIVSQSFGTDETTDPTVQDSFKQLHDIFVAATGLGGTILASAGDFGSADCPDPLFGCGTQPVASYPASDPLVTGVGGTEGSPYPGGLLGRHGYGGEQVWNESDPFGRATGGAPSVLFGTPSYQQGIPGNTGARTVPDVSYNAAINGGIRIYDSDPVVGGFVTFAGTSGGVPQWAAITAIANEARAASRQGSLGVLNTALYAIAQNRRSYREDFHDITVGTNAITTLAPSAPFTFPGFSAGPGYDLATGLGTPDVAHLIRDLARRPSDDHSHGDEPHASGDGNSQGGQQGEGKHHQVQSGR
jgi:subtilase family serine protease